MFILDISLGLVCCTVMNPFQWLIWSLVIFVVFFMSCLSVLENKPLFVTVLFHAGVTFNITGSLPFGSGSSHSCRTFPRSRFTKITVELQRLIANYFDNQFESFF